MYRKEVIRHKRSTIKDEIHTSILQRNVQKKICKNLPVIHALFYGGRSSAEYAACALGGEGAAGALLWLSARADQCLLRSRAGAGQYLVCKVQCLSGGSGCNDCRHCNGLYGFWREPDVSADCSSGGACLCAHRI